MNRGVPPTEPKARTGEFTPPGISPRARSNSSSLRWWLEVMNPILSVPGAGCPAARLGLPGQQGGDARGHVGAEQLDGAHHGGVRQGAVAVFEVEAVCAQVPLEQGNLRCHRLRRTDVERPLGTAELVELGPAARTPAAFG